MLPIAQVAGSESAVTPKPISAGSHSLNAHTHKWISYIYICINITILKGALWRPAFFQELKLRIGHGLYLACATQILHLAVLIPVVNHPNPPEFESWCVPFNRENMNCPSSHTSFELSQNPRNGEPSKPDCNPLVEQTRFSWLCSF